MIDLIIKLADLYENNIDINAKFGYLFGQLKNILPEVNINENTFRDWANQNIKILDQVKNNAWVDKINYIISSTFGPTYILLKSNQELTDFEIDDFSNFKETVSTFIPKYKGFPAMKLIQGLFEKESNKPNLNYDSNLAHNDWLLKGLRMIDQSFTTDELIPLAKTYINANQAQINNIRKHFSYQPKFLGAGIDGAAFDVGPNLVLKIFSSSKSYQAAKETMEKLHKNKDFAKTEAMIYDAQELPKFNGNKIYYYLMEKMIPINNLDEENCDRIRFVTNKIYNHIQSQHLNIKKLRQNMNIDEITKFIIENIIKLKNLIIHFTSKNIFNKIKQDNTTIKDNWFELLVEEVVIKLLTERNDLHTGNLGLTNFGEFRFFDSIV